MIHSPMIHEHYAVVSEATQARYDKAHAEFMRASEEYHAAWIALVREAYVHEQMEASDER